MHLRIHRTDGKTGSYRQEIDRRGEMLVRRFNPATMFRSGPIVVGTHNPFTILNSDEVCWIEVETEHETAKSLPKKVERIRRLAGREEYESLLARQWPLWRRHAQGLPGELLEAFVELSFRGGSELYLHVAGFVSDGPLVESIFGLPAVTATYEPNGTVFINPRCIARARVYHSSNRVNLSGVWVAEADEI